MSDEGRLVFVDPDSGDEFTVISPPPPANWECRLFGANAYGMTWTPAAGQVPNWFWRKMQYLCFGNRWVRK